MDSIAAIARRHGLRIVEDAEQGIMAGYRNRALGAIGDLGSFSFHETKNIISGEGGSLMVRDEELAQRAEIIRGKGTDRGRFFRGEVDKYTWQDVGSSFLPNEITAAFLWAQLEEAERLPVLLIASNPLRSMWSVPEWKSVMRSCWPLVAELSPSRNTN